MLAPSRTPRSCNMALWRKDALRVNGYDETFEGWGYEDTELGLRLENSGIRQRLMKFSGIVFHLHHDKASREGCPANEQRYMKSIREHRTWSPAGIDRHLSPAGQAEIFAAFSPAAALGK